MNLEDLLKDPLKLYKDKFGKPYSLRLTDDVLYFIDENIDEDSKTLETGAGVSTTLFALKGSEHTCITPHQMEVDHIKEYCRRRRISTDKINFIISRSEDILPQLKLDKLDIVLIDGRHAFPTPFMDWYYASARLKQGGLLILDDTEIWTIDVLRKFLLREPEWKLIKDFKKTSVFVKLSEGSHTKAWDEQRYVVSNSSKRKFTLRFWISYYAKLLGMERLLTLGSDIIHFKKKGK